MEILPLNRKEKMQAHAALFAVAVFYGLNYIIAKDVLDKEYMTPFGFIMLRVSVASIIFTVIHAFFVREKIERKDIKYAMLCSVFGAMINMLCFFEGLKYTSPIHASLIMLLTPIIVLVISALMIKEKVTSKKFIGIILGLIGGFLIIRESGVVNNQLSSFYGDMMIMANATSYGIYLVLVRKLTTKYHPITVIKWIFIFGTILILPFGGKDLYQTNFTVFTNDVWYSVLYVLIFSTSATYLLNAFALQKVLPSTVGFYIYFQPLIASIASILVLNEVINMNKLLSAILIFIGVYLVTKREKSVDFSISDKNT